MRTSKLGTVRAGFAAFALAVTMGLGGAAMAAESVHSPAFETYLDGERALRAGDVEAALRFLESAADRGVLSAQFRLARLYAEGRVVLADPVKAFRYYRSVADQSADADYFDPASAYIAEAFRMLAGYYRQGLEPAGLEPNPKRAAELLYHAATVFRDPGAQFELAKLYLAGEGVETNVRIAVLLLGKASRQRHAPAQALFGNLLWQGKVVKRVPAEGLALLALARDNADPLDRSWIAPLLAQALSKASDEEIEQASHAVVKLHMYRAQGGEPVRIVRPADPDPGAALQRPVAATLDGAETDGQPSVKGLEQSVARSTKGDKETSTPNAEGRQYESFQGQATGFSYQGLEDTPPRLGE